MNHQLKAWNEKWFLKGEDNGSGNKGGSDIPDFLR
jgi:hypothetical protein